MAPMRWQTDALLAGVALLIVVFGATASPVRADHVPRLDSAITDQTGVLQDDRTAIENALERLFDRTGVQLYVLFVETTGDLEMGAFARAVGDENLTDDDALLVVALGDRTDNLSVGSDLAAQVSQVELDRVRTQVLEPALADGDFGGAVIATADALGPVFAQAGPVTPPPATPGAGSGTGRGGISIWPILLVLVGAGLVVWFVLRFRRLRAERAAYLEEAAVQEQLGRQANSMLIKTDDAVRDAEQELGFAEAEFGAGLTATLRKSLEEAKAELREAFAIGQRLDDAEPETPEQRRKMIEEVIARAEKAQSLVVAQQQSVARLRDLEKNAPAVLERLDAEAAQLERRLGQAVSVEARLQRYAESAVQSVAGNRAAAKARLDFARERIKDGRHALASENRQAAAIAAQAAEDALEDGAALVDGLEHMASSLDELAAEFETALAAATKDVEAARAAVAVGQVAGVAQALDRAERMLAEARREAGSARPDLAEALRRANEANAEADKVLAGVRKAEAARARAAQASRSTIATAEANIVRARDYISGYRRSRPISRAARNRLAEAERTLARAREVSATDSGSALALAREADQLAADAYQLALQEAPRYDQPYTRQPPAVDLGSIVIGAILGGTGGRGGGSSFPGTSPRPGRRRGGFGGGFGGGRSTSGTFGTPGGGGRFGSGGFGGGRGGGGGFGGGRSSSGRW